MAKSVNDKFLTVIQKNTFYFFNSKFEESYEGYINSLKETLLIFTGFSNEYLKRLTTIIRIVDNPELNKLVYKEKWYNEKSPDNIQEWSDSAILKLIQKNDYFRKGLVNIFFEGASIPFLANTIPLFELKKLSISKLKFEIPELIDTLIRYKEKGSYSGMKGNNPETVVAEILEKFGISFETGDLKELIDNAPDNKRTMDFVIPNKKNPLIIAESSFLATTSSGQGDKSKTEISIDTLIKEHYPKAKFIGFVDGIGWYVRKGDLKRMVTAYEDVFTFHKDELQRFEKLLIETFKK